MLIRPYSNPDTIVSTVLIESPEKGMEIKEFQKFKEIVEEKNDSAVSYSQFQDAPKPQVWKEQKKRDDDTLLKVPTSPRSMS